MKIEDLTIEASIRVKFDTDKNANKSLDKFKEDYPTFKTKKRWDREYSIFITDTNSDVIKLKSGEIFSLVEDYIGFKYIEVSIEEEFYISKN